MGENRMPLCFIWVQIYVCRTRCTCYFNKKCIWDLCMKLKAPSNESDSQTFVFQRCNFKCAFTKYISTCHSYSYFHWNCSVDSMHFLSVTVLTDRFVLTTFLHFVEFCYIIIWYLNLWLQLLNYATTTLLFSDKKVNSTIISWNRVILLHGKGNHSSIWNAFL